MQRWFLLFLVLMIPSVLQADQPVPEDHSSVHLVFVMQYENALQAGERTATSRVGGLIIPTESIRPISIKIDDEFVGHAMSGYTTAEPVYILESGTYQFEFSCDGFRTVSSKLKVLGSGSKQFLIVKLLPDAGQIHDARSVAPKGSRTETGTE